MNHPAFRGQAKRASPRKRRWGQRLRRFTVWMLFLLPLLSIAQVLLLRWVNPPTSGVMLERVFELRSEGRVARIDQQWADWDALSPHLAIAVVAAEDQRFPEHNGFDTEAIRQAWQRYRGGGKSLRGGSTISQQVAKNLFLWSDRSWVRKGLETWYTGLIETLWPKQRILEMYLNIAEFGDGVYGAQAASQRYFGKPAAQLSAGQAASLAAVLPSPRKYSVTAPSAYVRRRAAWIEAQMQQLGGVDYLAPIVSTD
ncbi:MAG: monofunctional biosynthetic peptidoglycan transglycosylase [Pseudomarimonas sp.]